MREGDHSDTETGAYDGPSFLGLLSDLWEQSGAQFKGEWSLARAEFGEKVKLFFSGVAFVLVGAIVALYGAGAAVTTSIAALVAAGLAPMFAGLIVTFVLLLCAGLLIWLGLRRLSSTTFALDRTTRSVKRDLEFLKKGRTHDGITENEYTGSGRTETQG